MKAELYNDINPNNTLKNTGFKNKQTAINTIKLIKNRCNYYQFSVINTMYNRAKYHPHQTNNMKEAMIIFKRWINDYKKNRKGKISNYNFLKVDTIKKYLTYAKILNVSTDNIFIEKYLLYNGNIHKLCFKPINDDKTMDIISYRNKQLDKLLKNKFDNLYYKTGLYKGKPNKRHIKLILYGYSQDENNL